MNHSAIQKQPPQVSKLNTSRRQFLQRSAALSAASLGAGTVWSQGGRSPAVGQILDMSSAQQDVSKDFLVGSRAAWQEINATGGLRGQTIRHLTIETDGSVAQRDAAWAQLLGESACLASFGSCGNALAQALSKKSGGDFAQIAPWLQNNNVDELPGTYPIFSSRESQIQHVLQNMATLKIDSLNVVYQSHEEQESSGEDIRRIAQKLKLKLAEEPVQNDLSAQARKISASPIPTVLFVGGTPELVQFTRGWRRDSHMRTIITLADVNLQIAQQMSSGRTVPIIGTQPVPMVTAALPIVRRYRAALAKYYDEPPTALSLAGYISARYTAQMLLNARSLSRGAVSEACARRNTLNLDGFSIEVNNGRLLSAYVTQAMLGLDGRIVG